MKEDQQNSLGVVQQPKEAPSQEKKSILCGFRNGEHYHQCETFKQQIETEAANNVQGVQSQFAFPCRPVSQ